MSDPEGSAIDNRRPGLLTTKSSHASALHAPELGATPLERIAQFERDLVVQAGAGTGKTHALVTLYLHLLGGLTAARQPRAPGRIVVVTFTDKAAGELRERIRARLGALAESPERIAELEPSLVAAARALATALPEGGLWREALLQIGAAPIGTFHSFAGNLLRRHAARAGLDPDFTLLDEAEARAAATQAAERAVLDALVAGDDDVEELVAEYGFRGGGRGFGLIEQLLALRARLAEEGRGVAGLADNYAPERLSGEWDQAVHAFHGAVERLAALAGELGKESIERAHALLATLPRLDLRSSAALLTFRRELGPLRGKRGDERLGLVKEATSDALDRLQEALVSERAAPLGRATERLVGAVEEAYRAHKRRIGVVDFTDLLVLARDLMRDDAVVRATMRARTEVLLVDEFQDTNPVQAELVELLAGRQPATSPATQGRLESSRPATSPAAQGRQESSRPSTSPAAQGRLDDEDARLFLVGDRKQSIYEFRGADVGVFARAAATLVERGGGEVLLRQSRRALPSVIAFNNALFARAMAARGERQPDWDLVYAAARDDLTPFRVEATDDDGRRAGAELVRVEGGLSAVTRAHEVRAIARHMAALHVGGRRYGEMALLLRRFTHLGDYLDALRAAHVPYFVVRGRGFFAAQEVRDIAAALALLDNADDGEALVAVLRSPLVGVSDETLTRLGLTGQLRTGRLLDAKAELVELPRDEHERLMQFRRGFRELRLTADRLGPAACTQAIIDATDLVAVLATTTDGEQRAANLERLVERARAFESRGGDLRAFVGWLRRATEPGGELEAAQAQVADERDDVVRVMTVHQSKGLEFPVVYVPACGGMERLDVAPIGYDADEGLGLRLRSERRPSERVHTSASRRVYQTRRARQRAESLRLLYVASTRARDLVVFSGELLRGAQASWRAQVDALVGDGDGLLRVIEGATLSPPRPEPAAALARDDAAIQARLPSLLAPPAPRAASVTVAVTQLSDFELCPRRYQQFHALGLQEHPAAARAASPELLVDVDESAPPLDPLRRGTLAHRLLERTRFSRDGTDGAALDRLLTADGYDLRDPAVAEVRGHVTAFLDTAFARGLDGVPLRRELPFLLAVPFDGGTLYLRGQIDLLLLAADGITVIDYKHARAGEPEDYRFQLDAYALAVRRLYPQVPAVRSGLAFLKEGDPTPHVAAAPPSEPFLARLATLGRALADARAAERWDMRPLPTCHRLRCGFVYRCYPSER